MLGVVFTGIVEECQPILALTPREGLTRLSVAAQRVLEGTHVGDSISVSGVCLTVVERGPSFFEVEAVQETLRRTYLGQLRAGSFVNLERAMSAGRFFGGHYVQGHVDGTVQLVAAAPEGDSTLLRFECSKGPTGAVSLDPSDPSGQGGPSYLLRYLVPKGYVTLDGASLTVVDVDARGFSVVLIPHTRAVLSFSGEPPGTLTLGASVNVEVDVIAKYVERLLEHRAPPEGLAVGES